MNDRKLSKQQKDLLLALREIKDGDLRYTIFRQLLLAANLAIPLVELKNRAAVVFRTRLPLRSLCIPQAQQRF